MTSPTPVLLLVLALFLPLQQGSPPSAPECATWQECRDLALSAREAGDFERFHDLAWRAMQTRRGRDPELMFLLARAQSLSGRPGDALVMLRRIAELEAAFDALTHEDLARVRALPAWPDTRARLEAAATPGAPDTVAPSEAAAAGRPSTGPEPASTAPATTAAAAMPPPLARFPVARFVPGGLAYDAVSRRFIVGNLPARKLTVIGEGTNRTATLAGAEAALFDVRSIAIDRREGDLWVVSADCTAGADCRSALHKLQLISGRMLAVFEPPDGGRLLDVAVTAAGLLVLDAEGPRILRVANGGQERSGPATNGSKTGSKLGVVMKLPPGEPTSLAASPDGTALYVAYRDRIVRVQPGSGSARPLAASGNVKLEGFERLRYHRGSLIGLRAESDAYAVVRMPLTRAGTRVRAVEHLEAPVEEDMRPVGIDATGGELYYLLAGGSDAVIRAVPLK